MERLKDVLIAKGLKPTYQRLKILEYLDKHLNSHPTVEMIHDAVARKVPTISVTTVYNTLNTFIEKNLVSAVTITGTELHYDCVTTPHHHFLCKKCLRIFDVEIKCPIVEKNHVGGHQIDEIHGYLKGTCKECLGNKQSRARKE